MGRKVRNSMDRMGMLLIGVLYVVANEASSTP